MKKLFALLMVCVLASAVIAGDEDTIGVKQVTTQLSIRLKGESSYSPKERSRLGVGDGLKTDATGIAQAQIGDPKGGGMLAYVGPKTEIEVEELIQGADAKLKLNRGRIRGFRAKSDQPGFQMNTSNVNLAARGTEWLMEYVPEGGEATGRGFDLEAVPSERTHSLGTQPGQTRIALFEGLLEENEKKLMRGQTAIIEADGTFRANPDEFHFEGEPVDGQATLIVDGFRVYCRYHVGQDTPAIVRGSYGEEHQTTNTNAQGVDVVNPHGNVQGVQGQGHVEGGVENHPHP